MRENRRFSSRGMNVFISAVLLVAIVAVISVVVLNWATSLTKKETAHITNKTLDCTTADVTIESIFVDLGANRSRISVRNSGFTGDTLIDAAILSVTGQDSPNLTAFPIEFPQGAIETLEFNITGKIASCANFSRALVSTECASDDQSRPLTCVA